MAMQMQRAFNSRMLTKITKYTILEGSYNDDNDWVEGKSVTSKIYGVIKAGNKFSQFEEGIALHSEEGGHRTSDYRTLYINDKYSLDIGDKIGFKDTVFNILQQSDESVYGFNSFTIEKDKNWKQS